MGTRGAELTLEIAEKKARVPEQYQASEDVTPDVNATFVRQTRAETNAPVENTPAPLENTDTLSLADIGAEPLSPPALDQIIQTPKQNAAPKAPENSPAPTMQKVSAPAEMRATDLQSDEEKAAIGETNDSERKLESRLLDMSRKADPGDLQDTHVGSGYRSRLVNGQENAKTRAQKQRDQQTMQFAMAQAQAQIDALNADIERWERENEQLQAENDQLQKDNARDQQIIDQNARKIEDNRRQIEENTRQILLLDQLEAKRAAGLLAPDKISDEDKALLAQADYTPEELEENPDLLKEDKADKQVENKALQSENDDLTQQNEDLQQTIDERQARIDANTSRIDENEKKIQAARAEIKAIKADASLTDDEKAIKIKEQRDIFDSAGKDNTTAELEMQLDEEIHMFMREYAKTSKIDDPAERLRQEKALVESLSPEAKEFLSAEKTTEKLFKEDYFKTAEAPVSNNQTAAAVTPTLGR